ncbi:MAG TPA: alpha/beta hydrolase [Pseudonocardiaceae bacterium]|nr:alpha/beta hydrolase [Pseudonocardiaceae bacterium]
MPSLSSAVLRLAASTLGDKLGYHDLGETRRKVEKQQSDPASYDPPRTLLRKCAVVERTVSGMPVYEVAPRDGRYEAEVLYLHGGAYVHAIERSHWLFVGRLVDRLGCRVTVAQYPLAPDHRYDDTLAMVQATYCQALEEVEPARRVVMGDSAGGGLSLVLAQQLRARQLPQPGNLVLLSPWLDISMTDAMIPALDARDPYLSTPGLLAAGRMYAGTLDPRDPRVSPIYGRLDGLGRISVFIGTRDVLLADSRCLRQRTAQCGIDIDYVEYEDMPHAWMLQWIPEGWRALAQITGILQQSQT